MQKLFLKLSELKSIAKKEVNNHVKNWDSSQKVINKLIGTSATNKDWFQEASQQYTLSRKANGTRKIDYLVNALFNAYKCYYRMEYSRFNDNRVIDLKSKLEKSYLNSALNYIDDIIKAENDISENIRFLNESIALISEQNPSMGASYKKILRRFRTVAEVTQSIIKLCAEPIEDFDEEKSVKIRNSFLMIEEDLKKAQDSRNDLMVVLRNKMEDLYNYYNELTEFEKAKDRPSIVKLTKLYQQFEKYFINWKPFIYSKKYKKLADSKQQYSQYLHFINRQYPALKKDYDYCSYPRTNYDENRILNSFNIAVQNKELSQLNFKEVSDLKPGIDDMLELFRKILNSVYKNDLLQYYELFNNIINSPVSSVKIKELIRFEKHLEETINGKSNAEYFASKLTNMKQQVHDDLYELLNSLVQNTLEKADNHNEIKKNMDDIIKYFMEIGDIDKIEEVQTIKKNVIAAIHDMQIILQQLESSETKPKKAQLMKLKQSYNSALEKSRDIYCTIIENLSSRINKYIKKDSTESIDDRHARLVVMDKFSLKNYVIFIQNDVTFGRHEDNDIILKCDWVSEKHMKISQKNLKICDLNSTNGTFADGKKITGSLSVKDVSTFDISGVFHFSIRMINQTCNFKLQHIDSTQYLSDEDNRDFINSLLNTEFILLGKDGVCNINTVTGNIENIAGVNTFIISAEKGKFHYSSSAKVQAELITDSKNLSERYTFNLT